MNDQVNATTDSHLGPARRAWVESMVLLLRYKVLILTTTVLVTIGTVIYLFFFADVWYKSDANVMPARRSGGGLLDGITSGITSTIKDLGITPLAGKNKGDGIYSPLALISSREVESKLIKEFNFMSVYKTNTMEETFQEFKSHASADVLEEGNISITFEDTDPKRAANVANRLVEELNAVNSKLAMEEARFNRTYIEQRYSKLIGDLDSIDRALGEYQRKYGVYELKTQAQAQLAVLSTLEQQRYLSETQLANAEQLYGTESPEANALKTQLAELRGKLQELKTGMDRDAKSYFVPTDVMPDVALQYLQLMREEEIQSKLKAFILPSYEQAKLDETKQLLAYIVLDKAEPPIHKSRPKRLITLLMAMFGSFALCCLLVIGVAQLGNVRRRFHQDRNSLGL
ncbi:MAG TPA: Wzz/FepE/Etk N-terminal domain-containing protein [Candidatus Kapabacteria bacterium]|nr:Wzz/FepE/Etk N-terminal domain-containing protein [Candidatus Kapabacteria bacterium]